VGNDFHEDDYYLNNGDGLSGKLEAFWAYQQVFYGC
jgi:hypothetical protein